ncbi:putative E3 ubiquitin-protein ligase RING1a isoform X2 [Magnolia sinica]|uniref:putative E3 ubiquitin-protein ligase RING1a isoform X2 n=1 Tax=Magnolia sinica TaxID=86752 RepID=UPI00265894FD|nr:putative E3 ubiquitin-protein ligase RING1a isoform X2 [Magnolia sinica]
MPAQKRSSDNLKMEEEDDDSQQQLLLQQQQGDDEERDDEEEGDGMSVKSHALVRQKERETKKIKTFLLCSSDSDGSPSHSGGKDDEFILVKLSDIRKEVQCPICLGIIRKTRTVMECLHRFCRECIDKSMRLGNNECPACRTHCASRRSLRDDPNYDSLIAALYPDIDKYEEEELAFHEEEKTRNKQIQASIAQTLRRQSEALGRRRSVPKPTPAAFMRRSHRNAHLRARSRHGRDTGLAGSEDEDEDVNGNEGGKDSFSADEPCTEVRPKRCKRQRAAGSNLDGGCDENDDIEAGRDSRGASPARAGTPEVLVWGKGGTRSHTRHGSVSGLNGKNARSSRLSKLVDYLRSLEDNDDEFDVHLTLLPWDEKLPSLERPYLCCRPTVSVRHLRQFIALQLAVQAEELEILVKECLSTASMHCGSAVDPSSSTENPILKAQFDPCKEDKELQILDAQETLAGLHASCTTTRGNLVLVYRSRTKSQQT